MMIPSRCVVSLLAPIARCDRPRIQEIAGAELLALPTADRRRRAGPLAAGVEDASKDQRRGVVRRPAPVREAASARRQLAQAEQLPLHLRMRLQVQAALT